MSSQGKYALLASKLLPDLGKISAQFGGQNVNENLTSLPKAECLVNLSENFSLFPYLFAFNPALQTALQSFLTLKTANCFILQNENMAEFAPYIEQFIRNFYLISEQNQATYFSYATQSDKAVLTSNPQETPIYTALWASYADIFGQASFNSKSQTYAIKLGLVHQASHGVLLLNVANILQNLRIWHRLKSLFGQEFFYWQAEEISHNCSLPAYPLALKVILMGTAEELAQLSGIEPQLYSWADYAELNSCCYLFSNNQAQLWQNWVQMVAKANDLTLDNSAINSLYQYLVRETENCREVSISPQLIGNILQASYRLKTLTATSTELNSQDLEYYFAQQQQQKNSLQRQSQQMILQDQIYIATQGEYVGQINGLSVVEYQSNPLKFGEPVRISCLVKFGDGEILDIERKNELAGNIHAKGLMITEACLSGILQLPSQLPFSATVVFEQSYGEMDGDSASLACCLALISSLANLPLSQSIAVTGALDQFGNVLSVGGVNEKIEGFFAICQVRGLTGKQGVVIPKVCVVNLSLKKEVIEAVEQGKFQIWAVENLFQALEIFFAEEANNLPTLITQKLQENSETKGFYRGFNWRGIFSKNR